MWGSDGNKYTLSQFKSRTVVIYFYPKDDTPGCTMEACGFRDTIPAITKKKAVVLGISNDNYTSHKKFSDKYSLNFPLLCDTDRSVSKAYGVWQNKGIFGWGIVRTTFVIDPAGKIRKVFQQVNPTGHAKQVIKALK